MNPLWMLLGICVLAVLGGVYRGFQEHFGTNVLKGMAEYRARQRRYEATIEAERTGSPDTADKWKKSARR